MTPHVKQNPGPGSFVLKGRFALLGKGRHALFLVGGGEHGVEQSAFETPNSTNPNAAPFTLFTTSSTVTSAIGDRAIADPGRPPDFSATA